MAWNTAWTIKVNTQLVVNNSLHASYSIFQWTEDAHYCHPTICFCSFGCHFCLSNIHKVNVIQQGRMKHTHWITKLVNPIRPQSFLYHIMTFNTNSIWLVCRPWGSHVFPCWLLLPVHCIENYKLTQLSFVLLRLCQGFLKEVSSKLVLFNHVCVCSVARLQQIIAFCLETSRRPVVSKPNSAPLH